LLIAEDVGCFDLSRKEKQFVDPTQPELEPGPSKSGRSGASLMNQILLGNQNPVVNGKFKNLHKKLWGLYRE
jgi:hypothetical protein